MFKIESYKKNNFHKTSKSELFKILESDKTKSRKENHRANTLLPHKKLFSHSNLDLSQFYLNSINKNPSLNKQSESTKEYKELSNRKSNTYRYLNSTMSGYKGEEKLKQFTYRGNNKFQDIIKSQEKLIKNQRSLNTYRIPRKKNNLFGKDSNNNSCLLQKIRKICLNEKDYKNSTKRENAYEYLKRIKRVNSSFSKESIYSFEKRILNDIHTKYFLFDDSYFNDSNFLSIKKVKKKTIPKIKSKYLKEESKYDFKEHPLIGLSSIKEFSEKIEKIGKEADLIIEQTVNSKTDDSFSLINKKKFGKAYRNFDIYEKLKNIKKVHINVKKKKIINENVYKDYAQCLEYVNEEVGNRGGFSVFRTFKTKKRNQISNRSLFEKLRKAIIKISNFIKQRELKDEDIANFKIINESFTYPETKVLIDAIKNKNVSVCDNIIEKQKYIVLDFDYFLLTPLHWAVKRNFYIFLPVLLDYGSNVNARNINGETPLHIAVKNNFYDCACILLFYLASPFTKDNNGKKPIENTSDFDMLNLMKKIEKLHYSSYFHKTFNQDIFIQSGLWAFIKEEFQHKIKRDVFIYFNNKKIKDIFTLESKNNFENY